jgi:predicted lipase
MECMIVSSDKLKYIAIAYRGTESKLDAVTDGKIIMKPYGPKAERWEDECDPLPFDVDAKRGAEVHRGFNMACFKCNLMVEVSQALDKVIKKHPDYKLVFTGHSLGKGVLMSVIWKFLHFVG